MFSLILQIAATIAALAGTVCYFIPSVQDWVIIVCAAVTLCESLEQVFVSQKQNSLITEIATCLIAWVVASIAHLPILVTIAFALCLVENLLSIPTYYLLVTCLPDIISSKKK